MKVVFFRSILLSSQTSSWTPDQQIVYSHLLAQSIIRSEQAFSTDGTTVCYESILDFNCDDEGMIELCTFNVTRTAKTLNMTRRNIHYCLGFLNKIGYIQNDSIYCPKEIIEHGYFELKVESGLSKQLLIFYSWLYERASMYGGAIDTWSYKLAEMYGTTDTNVRMMESRLAQKGYVRRIKTLDRIYGKLQVIGA